MKEELLKKMEHLTPREQKVLEMRFGLKGQTTHTLEEVARDFDVTRERIRQIEAKALERLQVMVDNEQEKLPSETIKERVENDMKEANKGSDVQHTFIGLPNKYVMDILDEHHKALQELKK